MGLIAGKVRENKEGPGKSVSSFEGPCLLKGPNPGSLVLLKINNETVLEFTKYRTYPVIRNSSYYASMYHKIHGKVTLTL